MGPERWFSSVKQRPRVMSEGTISAVPFPWVWTLFLLCSTHLFTLCTSHIYTALSSQELPDSSILGPFCEACALSRLIVLRGKQYLRILKTTLIVSVKVPAFGFSTGYQLSFVFISHPIQGGPSPSLSSLLQLPVTFKGNSLKDLAQGLNEPMPITGTKCFHCAGTVRTPYFGGFQ